MEDKKILIGEKLEEAVQTVHVGWAVLPGKGLVRVVETDGFRAGFVIVAGIAKLAEERSYDPEIMLRRGEVEVTLYTYEAGGLTEEDIAMAQSIDALIG